MDAFGEMYDLAQRKGVTLRTAAFMKAISRVGRAKNPGRNVSPEPDVHPNFV